MQAAKKTVREKAQLTSPQPHLPAQEANPSAEVPYKFTSHPENPTHDEPTSSKATFQFGSPTQPILEPWSLQEFKFDPAVSTRPPPKPKTGSTGARLAQMAPEREQTYHEALNHTLIEAFKDMQMKNAEEMRLRQQQYEENLRRQEAMFHRQLQLLEAQIQQQSNSRPVFARSSDSPPPGFQPQPALSVHSSASSSPKQRSNERTTKPKSPDPRRSFAPPFSVGQPSVGQYPAPSTYPVGYGTPLAPQQRLPPTPVGVLDGRIDELAENLSSRVRMPSAHGRYIAFGLQHGVPGLEDELQRCRSKQQQLFQQLVDICNVYNVVRRAEQQANEFILEYKAENPNSRGGIPADFATAGDFQLHVFRMRQEKAPPAPVTRQEDVAVRLVLPLVQDAVVYIKQDWKRAVVISVDPARREIALQVQGSIKPHRFSYDQVSTNQPVANYKFPGIYTYKTDISLAEKFLARSATGSNANKFQIERYDNLLPEPPSPVNPKRWEQSDSDLFLRKAVMAAVRAIGSNVKDLITDAHAMRMLVYVITNYAAKQKDANYRAFWDELANSALHCQQSQLTFLELIDSLAYKLKPTKGTNNLLALYSHKHQQQNEDAGSFLERMQRDSSVLDDTLSEAECVQIFINNLTDIAYSTRLQERQGNWSTIFLERVFMREQSI